MRKNRAFTLIELLAVIIVLSIIMVLTIPNVIKSMNKAKDKAMIVYAKKLSKAANEYAFVNQDEFKNSDKITKNISDLMNNSTYSGTIDIYKNGNSIFSFTSNDNRSLCNISSNTQIDDKDITKEQCPKLDPDKMAMTNFASNALITAKTWLATGDNIETIPNKYKYNVYEFDEMGISVPNGYTGTIFVYKRETWGNWESSGGEPKKYFDAHKDEDLAIYVSVTDDNNYICFASFDNVNNKVSSTNDGECTDALYGKEPYIF